MFGYPGIDLQDKCWILLAKYNLKMLILTCGINGSYESLGVVSFQVITPKVPVADTVGAGDSFTAAFCASILNGKAGARSTQTGCELALRLYAERGDAGTAAGVEIRSLLEVKRYALGGPFVFIILF